MAHKTESLFISAILRQEDYKTPLLANVKPHWFATHSEEWAWIERYIERHHRCPSKTLFRTKFPDFQIVQSDDVEFCLEELREEFLRRSVIEMVDKAIDGIKDQADTDSLMDDLQKKIITLQAESQGSLNEADVLEDWEPIWGEAARRAERFAERGIAGVPTGFSTLDLITSGPQEGDYWIVAARLGQGKTWTLIRMAATAVYRGFTVQYDALEQTRSQIAMRAHTFLSAQSTRQGFRASALMGGKEFDLLSYKKFLQELKDETTGRLIVNDTSRGRVTPSTIAAQIERNRPDIVFIDYLTLMNSATGDWQAIAALSSELKGVAMRYQVPIVAAAQINRTAIGSDVPGAEHLAGADAIGQDADCVITMKQMSRHVIKMKLAKYRHGRDGQEWFNEFRINTGQFSEVSGDVAKDLIDEDRIEAASDGS